MRKLLFGLIVLVVTTPNIFSQSKIGFVQSDRIRAEFEEFKDAESQLQMEFRKVQFEYQTMLMSLDSMKKSYETQRLMSSPEWRREKEQEIAGREQTDKVAATKEYDFIIDGSVSLLFGNPTYDLTDDVLYELRKYSLPEDK